MFYSSFHVIKHCEINIMNRNMLFCINVTLILHFLNMDEASRTIRPGKKIDLRRDDRVRDGFGARCPVTDQITFFCSCSCRSTPCLCCVSIIIFAQEL